MSLAAGAFMLADAGFALHGWSMATAAAVSAACALVGSFLVVRRMSLLGDAIAHAVLPGIAVAVLAGGRLGGPFVVAGAVAAAPSMLGAVPPAPRPHVSARLPRGGAGTESK
jgi:ABC-type Mn2+/Zn2+ transport system permease subunit